MNILKFQNHFIKEMRFQNYAKSSIESYASQIRIFLNHFKHKKEPKYITTEEIKDWLMLSPSKATHKHRHGALLLFYKYIVEQPRKLHNVALPRQPKKLPKVIDKDILISKIEAINNLKHKAIITLAFSVGLRVSEVINLKINDIDSNRMIITISKAKGQKDRVVPLSDNVLNLLREYYRTYKPKEYMFNGQNSPKYSPESCNKLIKKYIGNEYTFHSLRHSCMTSLLESGTDIRIIQKLAGHNNIKTTQIYTHVSNALLSKIALPV